MPVNLIHIQKSLPEFASQAKAHSEAEKIYLHELERVFWLPMQAAWMKSRGSWDTRWIPTAACGAPCRWMRI